MSHLSRSSTDVLLLPVANECAAGGFVGSLWLTLVEARADGSLREVLRPIVGCILLYLLLSAFTRSYLTYRLQLQRASSARLDTLFPTFHALSYIAQTTRWTLGGDWFWEAKFDNKYRKHGADIITITSFFSPTPEFAVANAKAIRKLNLDRQTFRKPTQMYSVLAFFGQNLVIVENDDWKRHRKVVQSSFSEGAFPLVWTRTQSIIEEMAREEGWNDLVPGRSFVIDHVHDLTLRVALVVIAEAGFGIRLPWSDHQKDLGSQAPSGGIGVKLAQQHAPLVVAVQRCSTPDLESQPRRKDASDGPRESMLQRKQSVGSGRGFFGWCRDLVGQPLSVQEALRIVALNTLPRMILPKWAFWLPSTTLWTIDRGYVALHKYMQDLVVTRRERIIIGTDFEEDVDELAEGSDRREKRDLFGCLVRSALECRLQDGDTQTLTDEEVVGNVFIFLLAGHETTANSLAFTMANLALHPEIQDKLYAEVIRVAGEHGELTYSDYHKLVYTLACYNESIRLFPPVNILPKQAMCDTTLRASLEGGRGEEDVFVPKGSLVMIDVVGLHYNPAYWTKPTAYKPERFLEPYNKDAFVPFSAGPRACIGRRFTEVESVCALVHLVRRFRIKPVVRTGETLRDVQSRILKAKQVITLTPVHCPLAFEAR